MSDISSKETFWSIIVNNQIEIPIIQRDYAQGRLNERVTQVRNRFVDSLIYALTNSGEPLPLSFVYGKIEGRDKEIIIKRNKGAIEDVIRAVQSYAGHLNMEIECKISEKNNDNTNQSVTRFIPLDGQQRLTTLFLLHWYIIQRIHPDNKNELIGYLKGFKYKTRKSTSEFCEFLISITEELSKSLFSTQNKLSEQIENFTDFYRIWKNDPSVKGMFVMLDTIHSRLKVANKEELTKMWYGLVENNRITFDFLDLDKLNQTDELYVKMNSRGKHLTDYEHFKAWLQDYIKNKKILISFEEWEDRLDIDWLDLFWHERSKNIYQVDHVFYTFFKSINLYKYVLKKSNSESKIDKGLIEKIREPNRDKSYIPLTKYEETNFFDSKSLTFLFNTLNFLSAKDERTKYDNALKDIYCFPFSSNKKEDKTPKLSSLFLKNEKLFLSYWDRVYYYAFILFTIDESMQRNDLKKFKAWMRICRNLIYNTYIQNPDDFIKAVNSITKLSQHKFTIIEDLLNGFNVDFFETQAKEEKRKLEYFNLGEHWKEKIFQYENHEYFYGQINFIFNLLGEDSKNFDLFVKYGDKLSDIFEGVIERDNHLFQRALLAKGDYTGSADSIRHSFYKSDKGSLRARNDNWRKVFNNKENLEVLKSLLDDGRSFKEIIDSYSDITWRRYIIDFPKAIRFCNNRFFDFKNDLDIKLLKGKTYNGKHTDLYLFVLGCLLDKEKIENIKINHIPINYYRTKDKYPHIDFHNIGIDGTDELIFTINFSYDLVPEKHLKGFVVRIYKLNNGRFSEFEQDEDNVLFKIIENISEMKNAIDYIIKEIKNIDLILNQS